VFVLLIHGTGQCLLGKTQVFKPTKYSKSTEYTYITREPIVEKERFQVGKYIQGIALKTVVSSVLIVAGLYMMFTKVFIPVVDTYANSDEIVPIISPVVEDINSSLSLKEAEPFKFKELNASFREVAHEELDNPEDILKTTATAETSGDDQAEPEYFYLTIPSLEIEDAKVAINSTDLDPKKSIGHYKGTCLPDEACNVFVFGHSTYKSSRNRYKSGDYTEIFAHLDELKYGDEFMIKYKNVEYKYVVELTKVDRPENIDPLEQPLPRSLGKHESTVQLFTCTPSGTTKYRLSVIGRLVNTSAFSD
jgi:LPXTG-site transpeptidase (sortase) family protein